jgi:sugar-specific transcriptional regulator TrmB
MTREHTIEQAVDLLQELGLKEYESRCFVALSLLVKGTAKEISEVSEVPRTRVYDAVDILEARGLVEVQHGSPKLFRAVSVSEAAQTLRKQHEDNLSTLETNLQNLDAPNDRAEGVESQEVWSLTGHGAIQTRTEDVIAEADSEVVLLVVEEALLTDALVEHLRATADRGATVIVGGRRPLSPPTSRTPFPKRRSSRRNWTGWSVRSPTTRSPSAGCS